MARHVAARYGGGRRGMSIGYAVATSMGMRTGGSKRRGGARKSVGRKSRKR